MSNLADNTEMNITQLSAITGDYQERYLYYQLKLSMAKADRIDIIVSFLMESGVKLIMKDLESALERGTKIRILTGNYLGITQPSALYLLKKGLYDRIDLRFYQNRNRSFHPKSYIFHRGDYTELFIGSSNISRSALTSGIEWNYRLTSEKDRHSVDEFCKSFEDLFQNHAIIIDDAELKRYAQNWHKPAVSKDLEAFGAPEDAPGSTDAGGAKIIEAFEPRGAQIEALYALRDSRAEGATKGLVQAATGVGKTYLAAFDSKEFERVLFVAHREEILRQAARSFYNVRQSKDYGFFDGSTKDCTKAVIFASVSTLGQRKYLDPAYFPPDYFDYIVIDDYAIIGLSQRAA